MLGGPQLPAERDAFVGRAADLAALDARFAAGARLLSLLGTGGAGKTRLALRYALTRPEPWPGGAWFCDLTEARSLDGLLYAVASALDVPLGRDPVAQLGHAIAGRGRCLLVFDNVEQVAALAPDTLGRWLDRAAEATFLVTSRERLGLPGEQIHAVEPLDEAAAIQLFLARARAVSPDLTADPDTLSSLVRRLDGLPLAIELAAARCRMMSPRALLNRLNERFRLLASPGGRTPRHLTLRATLDWSWDLLRPEEQAALAQLSVFAGGFTLEAAEAVLEVGEARPAEVVAALVDRSLVRQRADARLDMLVSVAEYAAERLDRSGDRLAVERRHGDWYARFGIDPSFATLNSYDGAERRRAFGRDLDNLVVACQRAVARSDADVAVGTVTATSAVLLLKGPVVAQVALAGAVLALNLPPSARAQVAWVQGRAYQILGRVEEARTQFEQVLAIHRARGDRAAEGGLLGDLGGLSCDRAQMGEARTCFEQALTLTRDAGDRLKEALVLSSLGIFHKRQGQNEEARACLERALAIHREIGNRRTEAMTLALLGCLHQEHGRTEEAHACLMLSLSIHREFGDRRMESVVTGNLGNLHLGLGRFGEARAYLEQALTIQREVGQRQTEGVTHNILGDLYRELGHVEQAAAAYDQALAINREIALPHAEGVALGSLGILRLQQGRATEARELLERALTIHRTLRYTYSQGVWLGGLARLEAAAGSDRWYPLADEAVAVSAPYPAEHAEALATRARLRLDHGDPFGARADVNAARALAQLGNIGALIAIADARTCLAEGRADAAREAFREAEDLASAAHLGPASDVGKELAALRERLSEAVG